MIMMDSCVPPGFRFHPTDEELVGYYLKKKVATQKIDLDVIKDIDLYRIEPWDLQDRCRIGYEQQSEWYFFSHKDKKYPTGTRTNRATMAGFWKATGRDKALYNKLGLIGMRKTLVFYKGRAPTGQKTDWIIHEYRLESEENGPPQEEGWVVCRAFKKRIAAQMRNHEGWDPSYFLDHHIDQPSRTNSITDPTKYISTKNTQNLACIHELQSDNMNFMHSDPFIQLPQLQSPSLPIIKPPSFVSLVSDNSEEEDQIKAKELKVTDWRALDKFVASQLSHGDRNDHDGEGGSNNNMVSHYNSDMELLLLDSSCTIRDEDEEGKLDGLLSLDSDCDIEFAYKEIRNQGDGRDG